jgi:leucyl-tRNA synthetase
MFLGPLEASKPWSTHGIEGISRFLKKIWREYTDRQGQLNPKIQAHGPERADTERLLHETIQKVTDDTEHLRFNTAISQMMVFMNHIQGVPAWSHHSARVFLQLLAPYAPHIAEELWVRLGHQPSICHEPWPQADASKLVSSQVTVIVQVNGKLRGELAVAADAPEGFVVQLAHGNSKIAPWIEGKTLLKTVYVPGKILNLVVKG